MFGQAGQDVLPEGEGAVRYGRRAMRKDYSVPYYTRRKDTFLDISIHYPIINKILTRKNAHFLKPCIQEKATTKNVHFLDPIIHIVVDLY